MEYATNKPELEFSLVDQKMMQEALKEAQKAFEKGEVPVGAILTFEGEILARAHNLMESEGDPTSHAEILCLRQGAQVLGDWRLLGATLYTTLEPCVMCGGALLLARVSRVIWGAPDIRHGSHGSWVDLFETKHPTHTLQIVGGLYEEASADLMRRFFKQMRSQKSKF
jgi:tRNA(adenine34) deaminase